MFYVKVVDLRQTYPTPLVASMLGFRDLTGAEKAPPTQNRTFQSPPGIGLIIFNLFMLTLIFKVLFVSSSFFIYFILCIRHLHTLSFNFYPAGVLNVFWHMFFYLYIHSLLDRNESLSYNAICWRAVLI